MAPSQSSLQKMMNICEKFAREHNLQFSTNDNPKKSKIKCIAFLKKPRKLKPIKLNGKDLPWIESPETVLHLGTTFESNLDGLSSDILKKRATFIQKTNEILQEFKFATPGTKFHLNNIYNMSFNSSPLWDLFGESSASLEKTYNKALRMMWDIPMTSHRYILEPLSGETHLKFVLLKRFLNFENQVNNSPKSTLKFLFSI